MSGTMLNISLSLSHFNFKMSWSSFCQNLHEAISYSSLCSPGTIRPLNKQYFLVLLSTLVFICLQAWSKGMILNKPTDIRNKLTLWNNVFSMCRNTRRPGQPLSSLPLWQSPQELGRLSPCYCHQIRRAVWSGLASAAVWKMKSLCFYSIYWTL